MILFGSTNVDWKLEYQWDWAPWLTAILLASLISWIIYCYQSEVSPAKHFIRGLLTLLRLTTIALLLVMLSQLVFAGVRTGKPRIAILLDRSGSMQTEDIFDKEQTSEPISRSDAAQYLIELNNEQLISTISNVYQLELVTFDSEIDSQTISAENKSTWNLVPVNEQSMTRLGDALIRLLSKPSSAPLQAIIAYTDGQVTQGRTLEEASGLAKRKGVPLYLVGLGDDKPKPSLQLGTLIADDQVYPDDLVNFQATLSTSFLSGQTVKAELRRNDKLVADKMITIPEGEQRHSLPIQLIDRPANEGTYKYSLSARVVDSGDKEFYTDKLQHQLIVKKQQLRVLLAAGYPNYEFRYLKHLLERDSSVQLSCFLQESDPDHSIADITAIPRIPVSIDELNEYEVIVLMDIDPSLLPRSLWPQLSDFVSQQGGGLAIVAGPRFLPQRYLDKPAFLAMLPTKPSAGLINGWNDKDGYQIQATDLGKQSPMFLLADSSEKSESVWNRLPPLYWLSNVGAAKPSAQVLAYHPRYMATATKKSPAIVSQYYGSGRVLLHATDSTYRWREKVGDVYFARYWGQTLRMLGKEKINSSNKNIQLSTSEDKYQVGDAVKIELSGLISNDGEAPKIRLSRSGSSDKEIELDPITSSPGRWQANLSGLDAGNYRASLLYQESGVDIDSIDFDIESPPGELTNVTMNRNDLEKAAKTTRGKFYTYGEANLLVDQLPEGRSVALENMPPYEIWNRWPFLLGITLLLCTEWIVRKRQSML